MRIFIDIGHPAHVHYFKNFINIMKQRGHQFFITARDREAIHTLLNKEGIDFKNRGKGGSNWISKILYTIKADLLILYYSINFKPDLYLSHGSHYTMHIAKILGVKCICTGDSDHIKVNSKLLMPYLDCLITPSVYKIDYGDKHVRFDSYMELLYLHPENRKLEPREKIYEILKLNSSEKYFVLRFVAWNAFHDTEAVDFSIIQKRQLINILKDHGRVIISSESKLPDDLQKYTNTVPAEYFHSLLAYTELCVSEGATTASEAALLGIPTIYANPLEVSYCREQEQVFGLTSCISNGQLIISKIEELISTPNLKEIYQQRVNHLYSQKIDTTKFLVDFIENYKLN